MARRTIDIRDPEVLDIQVRIDVNDLDEEIFLAALENTDTEVVLDAIGQEDVLKAMKEAGWTYAFNDLGPLLDDDGAPTSGDNVLAKCEADPEFGAELFGELVERGALQVSHVIERMDRDNDFRKSLVAAIVTMYVGHFEDMRSSVRTLMAERAQAKVVQS